MPILVRRVDRRPGSPSIAELSADALMGVVRDLSFPRNAHAQPAANARAAAYVARRLAEDGRTVVEQGPHRNIVALPAGDGPIVLVGAHYDSVAGTPGADDNASAVAAMLGISRALARLAPHARVGIVGFNEEEDGIVGSADFATWWTSLPRPPIVCVHVLEMLGYASDAPGSQTFPPGPWRFLRPPTVADFIGVLGNGGSRRTVARIVDIARAATEVKVVTTRVLFGLERRLPDLDLSDHVRFWRAGIPSVLWTDTAFHRNPHYHMSTDTPDTLSPSFLSGVAHLVLRVVAREAGVDVV